MVEVPTSVEFTEALAKIQELETKISELSVTEIPEEVKQAVIVVCDWLKEVLTN